MSSVVLSCRVSRARLLAVLKPLVGLLPSRPVSDVGACVLLRVCATGANGMPVLAVVAKSPTELAEWIVDLNPADTVRGTACVNAAKLLSVLAAIQTEDVTVTASADGITIAGETAGRAAKYNLATEDPQEHQGALWPADVLPLRGSLSCCLLRSALERVIWCTDPRSDRPVMTGVWWHFSGNGLTLAASNGGRISTFDCGVLASPGRDFPAPPIDRQTVLPLAAAKSCLGMLPDDPASVEVRAELGALELRAVLPDGKFRIRFTTLNNKFPLFSDIIPPPNLSRTVFASAAQLGSLVKLAAMFRRENQLGLTLEIHRTAWKHGDIRVASASDQGAATLSMPATIPEELKPDDTTTRCASVCVNPDDFMQVCRMVKTDSVSFVVPDESLETIRVDAGPGWVLAFCQVEETGA